MSPPCSCPAPDQSAPAAGHLQPQGCPWQRRRAPRRGAGPTCPCPPQPFPLCSFISRRQLRVQFILLIKAAGPLRSWPPRGVQLPWCVAGRSGVFRSSEMGTETSSWGGDGSAVTSPSHTALKGSQGGEEEVVWGGSWLHAPLAPLLRELAAPCLAPPCTAPSPKGRRDPWKGRMGTGRCTPNWCKRAAPGSVG